MWDSTTAACRTTALAGRPASPFSAARGSAEVSGSGLAPESTGRDTGSGITGSAAQSRGCGDELLITQTGTSGSPKLYQHLQPESNKYQEMWFRYLSPSPPAGPTSPTRPFGLQ